MSEEEPEVPMTAKAGFGCSFAAILFAVILFSASLTFDLPLVVSGIMRILALLSFIAFVYSMVDAVKRYRGEAGIKDLSIEDLQARDFSSFWKLEKRSASSSIYGYRTEVWFETLIVRTFEETNQLKRNTEALTERYISILSTLVEFLELHWKKEGDYTVDRWSMYVGLFHDRLATTLKWLKVVVSLYEQLRKEFDQGSDLPQWNRQMFDHERRVMSEQTVVPFGGVPYVTASSCNAHVVRQEIERLRAWLSKP